MTIYKNVENLKFRKPENAICTVTGNIFFTFINVINTAAYKNVSNRQFPHLNENYRFC